MMNEIFFNEKKITNTSFSNKNLLKEGVIFLIEDSGDISKVTFIKVKKIKNFYVRKQFYISIKTNSSFIFEIKKQQYSLTNGIYLGPAYNSYVSFVSKDKRLLYNYKKYYKRSVNDYALTDSKDEWFSGLSAKHKIEYMLKNESYYNSI